MKTLVYKNYRVRFQKQIRKPIRNTRNSDKEENQPRGIYPLQYICNLSKVLGRHGKCNAMLQEVSGLIIQTVSQ